MSNDTTGFDCPFCSKEFERAQPFDTHLDSFHYTSLAELIDDGEFVFIDNERATAEHYHCTRCGNQYRDQQTAKRCCNTTGAMECVELECMIDLEDL